MTATPQEPIAVGMRLVLSGVVIGMAGALAVTSLMRSVLFGVSKTDPPTFIGASALLLLVALGAAYVPARRAGRIDPVITMK